MRGSINRNQPDRPTVSQIILSILAAVLLSVTTATVTDAQAATDTSHKDKSSSKSNKDNDDTKAKKHTDKKKDKENAGGVARSATEKGAASETEVATARSIAGLSAEARYISLADALTRARAEGGSGDLLKIDLEWDQARSAPTWDLTFSSGTEYEIHAISGQLLGTKLKAPAKLAVLSPLDLADGFVQGLLTFEEVLRKATANHGQIVLEMELKRLKARAMAIYEVVLADGTTFLYDAASGKPVNAL